MQSHVDRDDSLSINLKPDDGETGFYSKRVIEESKQTVRRLIGRLRSDH